METRVAYVLRADRQRPYMKPHFWLLKVRCPYCDEIHTHGGGTISERPEFDGTRVPHCHPVDGGEYTLVPADHMKIIRRTAFTYS